ncbi:MAG: hypothetical protein J7M25_05355 [Deltaproteobacteria bacterium]|nr:hypothetical protein [Deltaproteobacteria bacterium]
MTTLRRRTWAVAGLVGSMLLLLVLFACTEKNPDYDPNRFCDPGTRRCLDDQTRQVCLPSATWPDGDAGTPWTETCWTGAVCENGICVASPNAVRCSKQGDCAANEVCTVLVDPKDPTSLGTFCIAPPYPGKLTAGQACNAADDCAAGLCTRHVCFDACTVAADCRNQQLVCETLDVTVEGVRRAGVVSGCVPPKQ